MSATQPTLFPLGPLPDDPRDCWATPLDVFAAIDAALGPFAIDLAASAENAKCPVWFGKERDSLTVDWSLALDGKPGFLNPPFSELAAWAHKALMSSGAGADIAMLAPAHRCEQPWFQDYVIGKAQAVYFIRRRVAYVPPPGIAVSSPEFPSMVVWFSGRPTFTQLRGLG